MVALRAQATCGLAVSLPTSLDVTMEFEPAFLSGRTFAAVVAVVGAGVVYVLGRLVLARIARPAYPMPERLADRAQAARKSLLRIWGCAVAGGLLLALVGLLPGAGGRVFLLPGVVGVLLLLAAAAVFRDVAAGFSILLEGQMGPGDRVRLFGVDVEGVVEDVRLRRTVVREDDGSRVVVPNAKVGAVRAVSHRSGRSSDEASEPSAAGRRRGGRGSRRRGGRGRGRSKDRGSDRKEASPSSGAPASDEEPAASGEKEETSGDAEGPEDGAEPAGEMLSESPWSIE